MRYATANISSQTLHLYILYRRGALVGSSQSNNSGLKGSSDAHGIF